MLAVLWQVIRRRRLGTLWWSLGLIGFAALLAVAYPTVRGNSALDQTFAGLPTGVQAALGIDPGNALTSPVGYLNSQYFANILPALFLVFAIGLAAWSIAGDEAGGTLELLLANPVSRCRVAAERAGAIVALVAVLTAISAATLVVLAPDVGLNKGLDGERIVAATMASALLALSFAAVAFCVGATTGRRSLAIAVSATLAVAGYVIEGLAAQVPMLRPIRAASPWHWALGSDPLVHGLISQAWLLPLAQSVVLWAIGTAGFVRRDLR
jgi:ABC-2 type transport system permease protein